ncbi:MAG: hypothetical protein NWR72_11485, partial [Bacteroidia bacterium]|nr:hypothetical protein [Bacteroidia bacterium]
ARASLSASRKSIQLISHPLIERDWADQLQDDRPILVLIYPDAPYTEGEKWLISNTKPLGSAGEMMLALLPVDAIRADTDWKMALRSTHQPQSGHLGIWEGFGDEPTAMPGDFARTCTRADDLLWEGDIPPHRASEAWELSVWIHMGLETNYLPRLFVKQFSGDKEVFTERIMTINTRDVWGEWAIARDTLLIPQGRIRVTAKAQGETFDRLMLRPLIDTITGYSPSGDLILWNNYPLAPNP